MLPVIDLEGLRRAAPGALDRVATDIRAACETRGFFYLRNHGVDPDLIERVFDQAKAFFDQPLADKLTVATSRSTCNRGYEPLRAQTLEAGAPPDLKESFYIGRDVASDDPRVLAGRFNTGPNQWPSRLTLFPGAMRDYFEQAHELAGLLVRAMARSLTLPDGHFDPYLDDAAATLRLLYYPPQPGHPAPGEKGCGAHTDFGGITLLLQDTSGGLQVWDASTDAWTDAPPIPGTYVVNIGDLFARWTNGRYRSTLHRVINVSGRERQSVPFFLTGNPLHRVECLPTCLPPWEAPLFEPVTVEEHMRECYRRTYA